MKKTKNRMEFIVVEPQLGDYIMVGFVLLVSVPLSYYTTPNSTYFLVCLAFYWILAYSLLEDKYVTIIDKETNEVHITKTKMGNIKWIRVSPTDELVNVIKF